MRSNLMTVVAACASWLAGVGMAASQDDVIMLDAGAYTVEQAARGKARYQGFCAPCHLGDLSGTLAADTGAPPLRGAPFVASLQRKGAAAVFDYVKTTMPPDDPASLEDGTYLDILTYLIQANGFPAGSRELTAADLSHVRVGRPPVP
jgi:mono/diheme cytochrome c family protein